ncbi:metallophosphoesterase family protein [Paenibacillus sp. FSL K6-1230]|uniref:metallophosphoesterase family protein n=1 Tax=Paenibacillus sp. FSL K6-1230 TaxID=2921603 RepID=UPI0030F88BFA
MQRIAIVSDLHGNLAAWNAVLEDISVRGVTEIYCLGDLVGKGPNPVEVFESARKHCKIMIRGNWDELIGRESDENFSWHAKLLGPQRVRELGELPFHYDFLMSGRRIRLVHASPQSVYHRVQPWDSAESRMGMFDPTPDEKEDSRFEPDTVGYGDVHNAFLQHLHGRTLFNVGSVGNPLDMTEASYCILEGHIGDTTREGFSIQFIRVPYDIELAVRQAEEAKVPSLNYYIRELRTAIYRGLQD